MMLISTPEHSQPTYLCRFTVRSLRQLARRFSRQCGVSQTHLARRLGIPIMSQDVVTRIYLCDLPTHLDWQFVIQLSLPYCVTPSLNAAEWYRNVLPVSHHLLRLASA